MASQPSEAELQEMRLLALIDMLSSGALTALGKIVDPQTGKEGPVMLDQARMMIDLLEAIQYKTKGNVTDRERQVLELHLTNLRLTFVDESNRQRKGGGAAAAEAKPDTAKPDAKPEPAKPEAKKDEGSDSKDGFVDKRSGR
jgi:hypothetical protein